MCTGETYLRIQKWMFPQLVKCESQNYYLYIISLLIMTRVLRSIG